MKISLHRPRRSVWAVALVVFLVGLLAFFVAIPFLSSISFYLVAVAAALLLLGTWVF